MTEKLAPFLGFEAEKHNLIHHIHQFIQNYLKQESEKKIPELTIDLRQSLTDRDDWIKIRNMLKKNNLWSEDFGYSGFPNKLLPRLLSTGTYYDLNKKNRDEMYMCLIQMSTDGDERIIHHIDGNTNIDIFTYMDTDKFGLFAIYDLTQFEETLVAENRVFSFPEHRKAALRAVIKVIL